MRPILIWIAAAFVFGSFYLMAAHKEALRRDGQTVYLALAPVDPRSLMQGDYMALNYALTTKINSDRFDTTKKTPDSGTVVIMLDAQNAGNFARYYNGGPLAPGEHLLKYHFANYRPQIGAESFFIPEASGESFAHAAYAELKVSPDGTPLIVALCDKDRKPISADTGKPGH